MAKTQTLYISFRKLQKSHRPDVVLRLMMAFNDISLAHHSLEEWNQDQPGLRRHVQLGARMYFVRLQCGHLNEAVTIIRDILDDKRLLNDVARCSERAQEAFAKLSSCLGKGPAAQRFERYVAPIRNRAAFHYLRDVAERALEDRANRNEASRSSITVADESSLSRFEAADHIIDSIVVRQLWKLSREADLRETADCVLTYCSKLCDSFLVFAHEYATRQMKEHTV